MINVNICSKDNFTTDDYAYNYLDTAAEAEDDSIFQVENSIISNKIILTKWTVSVNSSEPPFKDGNNGFTTVPLKLCLIYAFMRISTAVLHREISRIKVTPRINY